MSSLKNYITGSSIWQNKSFAFLTTISIATMPRNPCEEEWVRLRAPNPLPLGSAVSPWSSQAPGERGRLRHRGHILHIIASSNHPGDSHLRGDRDRDISWIPYAWLKAQKTKHTICATGRGMRQSLRSLTLRVVPTPDTTAHATGPAIWVRTQFTATDSRLCSSCQSNKCSLHFSFMENPG